MSEETIRDKTAGEIAAFLRDEAKRLAQAGDRDGALALYAAAADVAQGQYRVLR